MSVKRKKASMVFSWQKSFSILTPWRKGKGDMLVESEVVLTKMKHFNNFHEKLLSADDSASTISMSVSEQDISEPGKASKVNSNLDNMPGQPLMESSSDYLSAIFSDSQRPRLYKFESEDSGVELPSGANSPSTPTGSEQSFVVHSRGSSCDSCNLNTPVPTPDPLLSLQQCSESNETEDSNNNSLCTTVDTQDYAFVQPEVELSSEIERLELHITEENTDLERTQCGALGDTSTNTEMTSEQLEEHAAGTEGPRSQCSAGARDNVTGVELELPPLRKSTTSDSLEEYMEECCRLSEVQQASSNPLGSLGPGQASSNPLGSLGPGQASSNPLASLGPGQASSNPLGSGQTSSNPLGSGLSYLEHICQLIEKIGQLQETNLRLQKQICGLQKDNRMTQTKEDFFQQHCSCGAASLAFQELKRHARSDFPSSSSGTLSDLSTIPELTRCPAVARQTDVGVEGGCQPPVWRRGLNRRSTAGETPYLCHSSEGLSASHQRLSENHTWGRVKDLVKRSRLRTQSSSSSSLKMSCPQLYRPDLGPVDLPGRNRTSMISLGHQNHLDLPWLQ